MIVSKNEKYINIFIWAAISLAVIFVSYPAVHGVVYAGHDLWGLCGRIEGIKSAWDCGQIFPVIMPNANNGYGYLEFMYPELFLLIPAFLRKCGLSMVDALHIYIFLINIATGVMTYFAVLSVLRCSKMPETSEQSTNQDYVCKIISAASSIFFLLAQYRLADVYIRAAIGEAVSMAFLPMVIAGLYHILDGDRRKWWMAVLGLSGLLNSHILSCVMVIPVITLFGVVFIKNVFTDRRWKEILIAIAAFLIVNSWFIIPFVKFYRFGLNTDALLITDVENHTALLMQLFSISSGGAGQDYFLRTLGPSALIILIISIVALVDAKECKIGLLGLILITFAGYLICSLDVMPWIWIKDMGGIVMKGLSFLQFPFRLLTVASACLVFAMALSIYECAALRKNHIVIVAVILTLGIIGSLKLMDDYVSYTVGMTDDYTGFEENVPDDYLPSGIDKSIFDDLNTYIDSPSASIVCNKNGTDVNIIYASEEDTTCNIPLLYYPCYRAIDENGNNIEVFQCDNKRIGLILPKGSHSVRLKIKLY